MALGVSSVDAMAPAMTAYGPITQNRVTVRSRSQQTPRQSAVAMRAQPVSTQRLTEEVDFEFVENEQTQQSTAAEGAKMFAMGGFVTAMLSGAWFMSKKYRSPSGSAEEKMSIMEAGMKSGAAKVETLLDVGRVLTQTNQPSSKFATLAVTGNVKTSSGKSYKDIEAATKAGLVAGCAPFPEGVDLFGFFNGLSEDEAKRYADVEITHGRICMLASLGFLVGEQVEGSSFLFDANVTGPAINHFQQVPATFWGLLGASIFVVEASRVQIAWQNPFDADKLFLLKADYTPGDYNFDPLGLAKGKDEAWLNDMKLKEINNGRVAMIAISGMIAQELVNGLNLLPADEVLEMGKSATLELMEKQCAGTPDEAACAKAFEAAERAAVFAGTNL